VTWQTQRKRPASPKSAWAESTRRQKLQPEVSPGQSDGPTVQTSPPSANRRTKQSRGARTTSISARNINQKLAQRSQTHAQTDQAKPSDQYGGQVILGCIPLATTANAQATHSITHTALLVPSRGITIEALRHNGFRHRRTTTTAQKATKTRVTTPTQTPIRLNETGRIRVTCISKYAPVTTVLIRRAFCL